MHSVYLNTMSHYTKQLSRLPQEGESYSTVKLHTCVPIELISIGQRAPGEAPQRDRVPKG